MVASTKKLQPHSVLTAFSKFLRSKCQVSAITCILVLTVLVHLEVIRKIKARQDLKE